MKSFIAQFSNCSPRQWFMLSVVFVLACVLYKVVPEGWHVGQLSAGFLIGLFAFASSVPYILKQGTKSQA